MARMIAAAVLIAGLASNAAADRAVGDSFQCACPGYSFLQTFKDNGQSCEEACGVSTGRAPSGPDWNAINRQREQQAAEEARQEAERQAEEARKEKVAREQRKFKEDQAEAVRSLKGASTGGGELKGFSGGTDMFGLKGVDTNKAGLKGDRPTRGSSTERMTAWSQLACASAIGQAAVDAAGAARTSGDLVEVDYLRAQSASAMIGGELGVGCDPAGPLASSFEPWKDSAKKKYADFLKTVEGWARSRVEVRAKIPVYREKVREAEKKLEVLRRAPAAAKAPAPPPKPGEPAPPTDDELLKRAEKALADSKSVLATAERIDKEDTAKLEKADKVHEKFAKAPASATPDDLLAEITGDGPK